MRTYDYIIAGGGLAGLSLAWHMSQSSSFDDASILLVDRERKHMNDRTWCFWRSSQHDFEDIVSHRWHRLSFADRHGLIDRTTGPYTYQMIRGIDFYQKVQRRIHSLAQFDVYYGLIQGRGQDAHGPYLTVDGKRIRARSWIFDSCYTAPGMPGPNASFSGRRLLQHFHGWTIETKHPAFKPESPILMDFRAPQGEFAQFYYLLPFSTHRALVETTHFSPTLLHERQYETELRRYLNDHLGVDRYEVLDQERGVIPMHFGFEAAPESRILRIGTLGGAVKPTTGYAFENIQQQCASIVSSLEKGLPPTLSGTHTSRFAFYDRLLLDILMKEGSHAAGIFSRLFRHNSMERILTFLREESHLLQEAGIFATLPFGPFLRAIGRQYFPSGAPHWKIATER